MNICKHCFRFIRQIEISDASDWKWYHIGSVRNPNIYCAMMNSKPLPKGRMSDLQKAEPLFRIRKVKQ